MSSLIGTARYCFFCGRLVRVDLGKVTRKTKGRFRRGKQQIVECRACGTKFKVEEISSGF